MADWDQDLYEQSLLLNAPTSIALTFADYIDPAIKDLNLIENVLASKPLNAFIDAHGLRPLLQFIGTGPDSVADVWPIARPEPKEYTEEDED